MKVYINDPAHVPTDSKPFSLIEEDLKAIQSVDTVVFGAHNDDEGFVFGKLFIDGLENKSYGAVIITDGAGSNYQGRTGPDLVALRTEESRVANEFMGANFFVGYQFPSSFLKGEKTFPQVVNNIEALLFWASPKEILVHSPLDDHVSHQFTTEAVLQAMRNRKMTNTELWGYGVWTPVLGTKLVKAVSLDSVASKRKFEGQSLFPSQNQANNYPAATAGADHYNVVMRDAHSAAGSGHAELYVDMRPLVSDERFRKFTAAQFGGGLSILSQAIRSDISLSECFAKLEVSEPNKARQIKYDMLSFSCIPQYIATVETMKTVLIK